MPLAGWKSFELEDSSESHLSPGERERDCPVAVTTTATDAVRAAAAAEVASDFLRFGSSWATSPLRSLSVFFLIYFFTLFHSASV